MEKHESVEVRTKDADAQQQSKNAMSLVIFFFQSVVVAALFRIVLGRSGDDTLIAVWRRLLLLCSYFYSAFCVLSATTRQSKARLFVCLSYAALLAFVVDAVLSHAAGAAIMYLDSVWIAAMFGQALAEHRASEEAHEKLGGELVVIAFLLIVFAAIVLSPVCIMEPDYGPEVLVVALPLLLCFFLPIAIMCVLKPRPSRGGPGIVVVLGVEYGTENVLVSSLLSPLILYLLPLHLVGEVGAAVVLWIYVLGLAVLLGYCVRLHACSACNSIDGWLSMRGNPKMVAPPELLNKK